MIVRAGLLYDGTLEPPKSNVISSSPTAKSPNFGCERRVRCTSGLRNAGIGQRARASRNVGRSGRDGSIASSTPGQRLVRAVANARKILAAGVTTIRDLGSSNAIAQDIRDGIAAGTIHGPRIRAAGAVLCMTGGHGWFLGRAVDSPWDARKAVREQLLAGADCIKLIATGGVLTQGRGAGQRAAHAGRTYAPRSMRRIARHARRRARDRHARHQERVARRRQFDRARAHARRRSDRAVQRTRHLSRADAERADLHPRTYRRG